MLGGGPVAGAVAPAGEPERPAVRVSDPAHIISLVPWLLHFQPGNADLVVMGTAPPRHRVTLTQRYDLGGLASPVLGAGMARHAVAMLAAQGCTRVTVVGFGPDRLVAPAAARLRQATSAAGLEQGELLRADGGRWWSYLCTNPDCRPPYGTPYSPGGDPVTAAFQAAGAPAPLASRDALAATIAPATGTEAASMQLAMRRAATRAGRLDARGSQPGRKARQPPVVISGIRAVTAAIRTYRHGGSITSGDQLAWLALTRCWPTPPAGSRSVTGRGSAFRRPWPGGSPRWPPPRPIAALSSSSRCAWRTARRSSTCTPRPRC
jgi:hypothetical protein